MYMTLTYIMYQYHVSRMHIANHSNSNSKTYHRCMCMVYGRMVYVYGVSDSISMHISQYLICISISISISFTGVFITFILHSFMSCPCRLGRDHARPRAHAHARAHARARATACRVTARTDQAGGSTPRPRR